jgi:metal-responsive CopG/Arc/MetJ family transcriptional regulator
MKTITINVSEPVYREFRERAQKLDRTASELIREAMEYYLRDRLRESRSVLTFAALDLGKMKKPFRRSDDLLAEMTRDVRS